MNRHAGAILALAMCAVTALPHPVSGAESGEGSASGVRRRVLLSNCDGTSPSQSQIMCFDIYPDSLQYVRTVVHPFDGHCRVPVAAVAAEGIVYVAEWSGQDDSATADPSHARILKYDLDGNYLGVLVDEILSPEGAKVCRLERIAASRDGRYLYVYQPGESKSGVAARFYRYATADGTGGPILTDFEFDAPSGIDESGDGKTLFVTDQNTDTDGNVYVFAVKDDGFELVRKYYAEEARGAYLDEETGRLYVSGKRIEAFDYKGGGNEAIASLKSELSTYTQVTKIGQELYAVRYNRGTVRRVSYNPNDGSELLCADLAPGYQTSLKQSNLKEIYNIGCVLALSECGVESSVKEVARYTFEDDVCSASYANSISPAFPIRAVCTQSGTQGVSGKGLYFAQSRANAVIEGSGGMVGGDYGIFMWFGGKGFTASSDCYLLSNSMRDQNKGYLSLMVENGKLTLKASFISGVAKEGVLQSGEVKLQDKNSTLFTDKKYHHLGVVKKKDTISLWLDGKKVATESGVKLGLDDTMDFVLGGSADGSGYFVIQNSYMDDLRFFDGAPSDAQVEAMYEEHREAVANLGEPKRPSAYTYDASAAQTYGSVVEHAYAYQPAYQPPSLTVGSDGVLWLIYSCEAVASSYFSIGNIRYSSDGGSTWLSENDRDTVMACRSVPFECKEDGTMYAFGRTSYNYGTTGYSIWYNNPTNGCEGRVGFTARALTESSPCTVFTNDSNSAVLRFPKKKAECDLATEQVIYPGGGCVLDGRIYLSYLAKDKLGVISGKIVSGAGISDFKAQAASVVVQADKPFPGPVFAGLDGDVAAFVPAGTDASGLALVHLATCAKDGGKLAVSEEGIVLPGADRPFAVKYDSVLCHYWAVTAPQGTSLCLYASKDLRNWELADTLFAVSDPATTRVSNPAFDFSGRDLAVAFNLSCLDGSPSPRALDEANYVMVRKVWSFRRNSPWKKGLTIRVR